MGAFQIVWFDVASGIVTGIFTLLAAVISTRVTANSILQKRGELLLQAQERIYALMGEVITVWRLWNTIVPETPSPISVDSPYWPLYERATKAAGEVEAIVMKLTSEQPLNTPELDAIGKFRQAFSSVRKCLREGHPVPWYSSNSGGYVALKRSATSLTHLVILRARDVNRNVAAMQYGVVTSNYFEGVWQELHTDAQAIEKLKATWTPKD